MDPPRDDGETVGESLSGETVDAVREGEGRGHDRGARRSDFVQAFALPGAVLGRHDVGAVGDGDDRDVSGGSGEGLAESESEVLGVNGVRLDRLDERTDLTRQFVEVGVEARAVWALRRGQGDQLTERGLPDLIDRFPAEEGRVGLGHRAVEIIDEDHAAGRRRRGAIDASQDVQELGGHAEPRSSKEPVG